MKSKVLKMSLLSSLVATSASLAFAQVTTGPQQLPTQQPQQQQPQALPKSQVQPKQMDAHQEILSILKSGRSYRLLLQIQKQLEGLSTSGADQTLVMSIKARVEDLTTEYNKLADAADKIELGVVSANSKLDVVSNKEDAISSQIQSNEQARVNDVIELQLETGKMDASLYIPESQGGRLELVRDLVSAKASVAESKGWQTDEIKHYLGKANQDYSKLNYHGALSNYRKAYQHIVGRLGHKLAPKSWFISTFHD